MKTIDVSEFQGKIDWKAVKASGVLGVVIRAGYGNGNIDAEFKRNIKGARKAGLNVGIYWFSYAYTIDMAKNEAEKCDEIIRDYKDELTMPVFFDWEYDSMRYAKKEGASPDKKLITGMTKAFCEAIQDLGYTAGYYLNYDYSQNYYDESKLKKYKRWYAWYNEDKPDNCYLWQYTSEGDVPGIDGNVDMDTLFGDLSYVSFKPTNISNKEKKPQETNKYGAYEVGKTYTVDVKSALNVRTGAGLDYPLVGYDNLTPDGKRHANAWGALLPGTKVTCVDTMKTGDQTWMEIPSGWICAVNGKNVYVK